MESPVSPVRIAGFTKVPHIEAIASIRDAIGSCGGFILDSHMYSNSMIAISFEIRKGSLVPLLQALEVAGVCLSSDSQGQLWTETGPTEAATRVMASLNVNFIHDDPPLRIEVPAVPG